MPEKVEKIAVLDSEVQAQMLEAVLRDRGIPHMMQSYHSSAYDGIFQLGAGWGHVAAPSEYRDEILTALEELSTDAPDGLDEDLDGSEKSV